MIINPYLVQPGVPAFTGLLDTYTGAAAAYSAARRLSSTYTGSLIRVRRSSDNTEQDIGYTAGNVLDESALTTFVGAGNGFVTKWYDQSGNARELIRTIAVDQPRIVLSGTIETDASKPAVNFDGYKPMLYATGVSYAAAAILGKVTTQNIINYVVGGVSGGTDNGLYYNGTLGGGNIFGAFDGTNSVTSNIGDLNRILGWFNMKLSRMYVSKNGGSLFDGTFSNSIIFGGNTLNGLGGRDVGTDGLYFKGKIQEAVFWSSEQSANESGIKSNINTFYSIY
jgi:hypothetical protein